MTRDAQAESQHTLINIWSALDKAFESRRGLGEIAKVQLSEYVVLDALIGNVDRHHQNWGLLRGRARDRLFGFLAPSFDHASSLGRELPDGGPRKRTRTNLLNENIIGPEYIEKGRGGIFWSEDEGRHAPSPLELVRRAYQHHPEFFQTSKQKIGRVEESSLCEIVERVPEDWMSALERKFSIAQMRYNIDELRKAFK